MPKVIEGVLRLRGKLDPLFSGAQTGLLLLIRLYWGFQFAQDGWGKLTHLSRVVEFRLSQSACSRSDRSVRRPG
jgi:hypothetical protein